MDAQLWVGHDDDGREFGEVRGITHGPLAPEAWHGLAAAIAELAAFTPTQAPAQPEGGAT